tara:strand:+ start:5502 stop:6293 length:792 start_codon:yes stop_codon:yes gene_type:complete
MSKINHKLNQIQTKLKVGKGHRNNFGKYNYRNLADIFEGLKSLLKESGCYVTVSDEIICVNNFNYIKATAIFSDGTESIQTTGWARESVQKKGMDDSQITGATSSYARKYALNGLFAIDDTEDADSMDNREHSTDVKPLKDEPKKAVSNKIAKDNVSESDIPVDWEVGRKSLILFGKHKGTKWEDLPIDYVNWLSEKSDNEKWRQMANAEKLTRVTENSLKNAQEQEAELNPHLPVTPPESAKDKKIQFLDDLSSTSNEKLPF